MAAPIPDAWTQVRILDGGGRVVQIDRAQASTLAGLLRAALAGVPAGGEAGAAVDGKVGEKAGTAARESVGGPAAARPFGPPTLRLELLQGSQRLGVLEVAAPLLRWTPVAADNAVGAARLVQPDAATLQALVDELARWAPR